MWNLWTRTKHTSFIVNVTKGQDDKPDIGAELKEHEQKEETQGSVITENKGYNVAFSVTLGYSGYYGPFSMPTALVYRDIITNVGNSYNPSNGFFTAPVRGVYFFTIRMFAILNQGGYVRASLNHNGVTKMVAEKYQPATLIEQYTDNSVTLLLEKSDTIIVNLDAGKIYDDKEKRNAFTGFLLFPM
ncbi:complement C1q-like protein 2 [Esox lucius]|uniref:C1q domain-containing protein n=1 Tax=Esox lucius TaxID=8010 RepID=A0A3P8Y1Y9_ESOLU|nr:complement C1q-like protein 2 [Esox lucius]